MTIPGKSVKKTLIFRWNRKSLKQCIAEILKHAFKNQVPVDKEIIKAAGVNAGKVTFGDPDMGTAKKLIRDYYLGGSRK